MQNVFDELKEFLKYEPETGEFLWIKIKPHNYKGKLGHTAGSINTHYRTGKRYIFLCHGKKRIKAHRFAWYCVTGEIPNQIDHINGDGTDNRFCNLRNVTAIENSRNKRRRTGNKFSNVMGVSWYKRSSKWLSSITHNGKNIHLGLFVNFDDAVTARKNAEKFYNFHPNHGSDRSL